MFKYNQAMKSPTVNNSLYWQMLKVMMSAKHRVIALAEPFGLTSMQVFTIGLLEPGNPQPMNSLSGVLGCDASNVTGIVDRLEERKLIRRQDNPEDRRQKMIVLSADGVKMRQQIIDRLIKDEGSIFATLSPADKKELSRILAQLV